MNDVYEKISYANGEYVITTDKEKISFDTVCKLLNNSYWAKERKRETIVKSIENSLCYSIFYKGDLIGFARVITDYATLAYLCDVIIEEKHRGNGLGKWLMECMLSNPALKQMKWLLATSDAHKLYEKYGFEGLKMPEKYMMKY